MVNDKQTLKLIDQLIDCWSEWSTQEDYYLNVLAPSIVHSDGPPNATLQEEKIIRLLRTRMSSDDWQRLPEILCWRREWKKNQSRRAQEEQIRAHREREDRLRRLEQERERARKEEEERLLRQKQELEQWNNLVAALKDVFERDFLTADAWFLQQCPNAPPRRRNEYSRLKAEFIRDWALRELGEKLDREQADSIAATTGNILVTARAGSGKTRTLVTRAIFLQRHCGVSPRELLLLAFNRAAAKEMRNRLAAALGDDLPHVMTFHALGHALVEPREKLLFDNVDANQLGLSRKVQAIIEEHINSDEYNKLIRDLMLEFFREDLQRIVDGKLLPVEGFIGYRRGLSRESLKGDRVESFLEKLVANTLFEHGIPYQFKESFRWNEVNYRPDFRINQPAQVVIECFGNFGEDDHDERADAKRKFWKRMSNRGWTFVEVSLEDIWHGEEAFVAQLLQSLREAKIPSDRLSKQEIWERIRKRTVDQFTEAMRNFIGRCRQKGLCQNDLQRMVDQHKACLNSEKAFLEVGVSVYSRYLDRLITDREQDFNGLMGQAASMIRDGKYTFTRDVGREQGKLSRLRFVLIDEFQDFSQMFQDLVSAIQEVNPTVELFCVGDDWQAINSFAGSELRFFERFENYIDDVDRHMLPNNYRSAKTVVDVSNALMTGKGTPARTSRNARGNCLLLDLDKFQSSPIEEHIHDKERYAPAVLRLIQYCIDNGQKVALLSRRKSVNDFLNRIRHYLPEASHLSVEASTVHRFKGKEETAVIVLDAIQGKFPLIHPNWVFCRILGDNPVEIEKEEERLFYVALTRAKDTLILLTDSTRESPYINNIIANRTLNELDWNCLPPVISPSDQREWLEVRVHKAYSTPTEALKAQGYKYRGSGKYWYKLVEEGFSLEGLCMQRWLSGCSITIYSSTGELLSTWSSSLD